MFTVFIWLNATTWQLFKHDHYIILIPEELIILKYIVALIKFQGAVFNQINIMVYVKQPGYTV